MERVELQAFLHSFLNCDGFKDFCPNGLQVEGNTFISRLVTGVTASQRLIDRAVAMQADAIIVHHGYFWKNESPVLTGMKFQRIKSLMISGINLFAYHLPLDQHPEIGNNAMLAQKLGIVDNNPQSTDLLRVGRFPVAKSSAAFSQELSNVLNRNPLHIEPESNQMIQSIAWCSGGAQSMIEQAAELGVDAFFSGEISEQTTHIARENNMHYYAVGHHASERFGVEALGRVIANQFGIEVNFIDIDNPA